MHELCHKKIHNHSSVGKRKALPLLDRVMPNWKERKQQLNQVKVA